MDQPAVTLGRRILVVGTSGSGKTTLAQRLAERLGIPYVCNDAILHRPNWRPNPPDQRLAEFDAATRGEAWTFDGNIGSLKAPEDILIAERADTIIWLDFPRYVVMRQLLRRTISRCWRRTELWHGNRETWRMSFTSNDSILLWAWKSHGLNRQRYAAMFADPRWGHLTKLRLRSRREIEHVLGHAM